MMFGQLRLSKARTPQTAHLLPTLAIGDNASIWNEDIGLLPTEQFLCMMKKKKMDINGGYANG